MDNCITPKYNFYQVTTVTMEEDDKGKVHRTKQVHLVDSPNTEKIQSLVAENMPETYDWEITNISLSKIELVY